MRASAARLDALTSLRFFAALLVLIFHSAQFFAPRGIIQAVSGAGFIGVEFFFVLSGFILTWTHNSALPSRYFYGRRFARIYPLHLLTAVIAFPIILVLGGDPGVVQDVFNLLLLHAWVPLGSFVGALNPVSWTLSCEAFFYLIFPMLVRWLASLPFLRSAICIGLGMITVCVALTFFVPSIAPALTYNGPWFQVGAFAIGILLAHLMKNDAVRTPSLRVAIPLFVASYALAAAIVALLPIVPTRYTVAGIFVLPSVCVLIASVSHPTAGGVLRSGWLVKAGEASFALYLIHYMLIRAVSVVTVDAIGTALGLAIAAVTGLLAILLSRMVFVGIERPLEQILRRWIGTPALEQNASESSAGPAPPGVGR